MMEKKVTEILSIQTLKLPIQAMKLPAPPTLPPTLLSAPPQDKMILMSMALVCLLSLALVFGYFLHITLINLKIKKSSIKNRINHQNDIIYLRKIYNK